MRDCVCPICYSFEHKLGVLHRTMEDVRKEVSCQCCVDSRLWSALQNPSTFRYHTTCSKIPYRGLELPHSQGFTPKFYRLPCVLTRDLTPHTLTWPCHLCGLDKLLPDATTCLCFNVAAMAKQVKFNRRQITWYRTGKGTGKWQSKEVMREHHGTLDELWGDVKREAPYYKYHSWLIPYLRWQHKLNAATFDADTEIVVLTDFANQFEMKGEATETCAYGIKCNELVCLCLSHPSPDVVPGVERDVRCDYVRIWSTVGTCAQFHHKALDDLFYLFKHGDAVKGIPPIPNLKVIHVWSDGHGSTYKGFPNFGRMVEKRDQYCIHHHFFPSHHACGPQDNAGKDPRIAMEREIGFGNAANLYNYHECWKWCEANMAEPSRLHDHSGTWGCNGAYIWKAYSDGNDHDEHREEHAVLDLRRKEYQAIHGTHELYSFRTHPSFNENMQCRFVPCFCPSCATYQFDRCFLKPISGTPHMASCRCTGEFNLSETRQMARRRREAQARRNEEAALAAGAAGDHSDIDSLI